MKQTIIAAILLTGWCAHATQLVVSNVVVAYQDEAARASYDGRPGELVRNTDRHGFTLYTGDVGGTLYLPVGENVFWVEAGTDALDNADMLESVATLAEAYVNSFPILDRPLHTPTVVLESGTYEFDTAYVLPPLRYVAEYASALGTAEYRSNISKVVLSDTFDNAFAIVGEPTFEGIAFTDPVTVSSDAVFTKCTFESPTYPGGATVFEGCVFESKVAKNGTTTGGIFLDCFVTDNAAADDSFEDFSGSLLNSTVKSSGSFKGSFTGMARNSLVVGSDAFTASDVTVSIDVVNCLFTGSSGSWLSATITDTGRGFIGCIGISSTVTTTVTKVTISTDESGMLFSHNIPAADISGISVNAAAIAINIADISNNTTLLGTHATTLQGLGDDLVANAGYIQDNEDDLVTVNTSLSTAEANIVSNAGDIDDNDIDISTLNGLLVALDGDVGDNATTIGAHTTSIAVQSAAIISNDGDIADNVSAIAAVVSTASGNTSGIGANTTSITDNDTDIFNNTSDISDNSSDIVANDADIAALNTAVIDVNAEVDAVYDAVPDMTFDNGWVWETTVDGMRLVAP